jgi:hypothetical protein
MTEPAAGQPVEQVHLENIWFSRVLRTRDRLVQSGRQFISSLLGLGVRGEIKPVLRAVFGGAWLR